MDGCYTEKSGYLYWKESHYNNEEHDSLKGWARLLKLPVPQKMKYYLWRVCKNNIHICNFARGNRVQKSIICPLCHMDIKHMRHVFVECQFVRSCWDVIGGGFDMSVVENL